MGRQASERAPAKARVLSPKPQRGRCLVWIHPFLYLALMCNFADSRLKAAGVNGGMSNLNDIIETFQNRVKSPVFGSVVLAFIGFNWRELAYLIFETTVPILKRTAHFDANTNVWSLFFGPIIIGSILALVMPWVTDWFSRAVERPVVNRRLLGARSASKVMEEKEKLAKIRLVNKKIDDAEEIRREEKRIASEKLREEEQIAAAKRREEELIAQALRDQEALKVENEKVREELQKALKTNREKSNFSPYVNSKDQKFAEDEAVRCLHNKMKIPPSIGQDVRNLEFEIPSAFNVDWIENCQHLERLTINPNASNDNKILLWEVSNWPKLALFSNLTFLSITWAGVKGGASLDPLKNLSNLRELHLEHFNANDISSLEKLKKITRLFLSYTDVRDLSPISKYYDLVVLVINDTMITNLEPLRNLHNLAYVEASELSVLDWSPLDHVDDVRGRPENWVRESGKYFSLP